MFKKASATDELMSDMHQNLIKTAAGGRQHAQLTRAVDLLDLAARHLEEGGLPEMSTKVVDILADVAGKLTTPSESEMNADTQE